MASSLSLVACQCQCVTKPDLAGVIQEDQNFIYYSAVNMRCTTFCIGDNVLLKTKQRHTNNNYDQNDKQNHTSKENKIDVVKQESNTTLADEFNRLTQQSMLISPINNDNNNNTTTNSISLVDGKAVPMIVAMPDDEIIQQARLQILPTVRKSQQILRNLRRQQLDEYYYNLDVVESLSDNNGHVYGCVYYGLNQDNYNKNNNTNHNTSISCDCHNITQQNKIILAKSSLLSNLTDDELYLHHLQSQSQSKHISSRPSTPKKSNNSISLLNTPATTTTNSKQIYSSHSNNNTNINGDLNNNDINTNTNNNDKNIGFFDLKFDNFETRTTNQNSSTPNTQPTINTTTTIEDDGYDSDLEIEQQRLTNALTLESAKTNTNTGVNTSLPHNTSLYNNANHYMSPEHETFTNTDSYQLGKIVALLYEKSTKLQLCIYSLYRFDKNEYVIQTDLRIITNVFNIVDHAFILSHQDYAISPPIPSIFSSITGGHIHSHMNHRGCQEYYNNIEKIQQRQERQQLQNNTYVDDDDNNNNVNDTNNTQHTHHYHTISPNPNLDEKQYHTRQVFVCQYLQQGTSPTLIPIISTQQSSTSTLASNCQLSINQSATYVSKNLGSTSTNQNAMQSSHTNNTKTDKSTLATTTKTTTTTTLGKKMKLSSEFSDLQKLRSYCRFVQDQFNIESYYIPIEQLDEYDLAIVEGREDDIYQCNNDVGMNDNDNTSNTSFTTLSSIPKQPKIPIKTPFHLTVEPSLLNLYKKSLEPGYIGVSVGAPLHERGTEFKTIYHFLLHGIGKRHAGGALLVSGLPGTGKTATVNQTLNRLEYEARYNSIARHTVVRLNATQLRDPQEIWPLLLQGLTMTHPLGFFIAQNATKKQAMSILQHLTKQSLNIDLLGGGGSSVTTTNNNDVKNETSSGTKTVQGRGRPSKLTKKTVTTKNKKNDINNIDSSKLRGNDYLDWIWNNVHPRDYSKYHNEIMSEVSQTSITNEMLEYCIFIVDEADYMITAHQRELYLLLDFPSSENLPLSILLISNTFSLWEKSLRILSRVGLKQLSFESYTHNNISAIIRARLDQANKQYVTNLGQYYRYVILNNNNNNNNDQISPQLITSALEQIVLEKKETQKTMLTQLHQQYMEHVFNNTTNHDKKNKSNKSTKRKSTDFNDDNNINVENDLSAQFEHYDSFYTAYHTIYPDLFTPITISNVTYNIDELVIALSYVRYKQSHALIGLDDDAIRFTSMRVAQLSGDCRRALDITAKALTIAANNRTTSMDKIRVTIESINIAIRNTHKSIVGTFISQLSKTQLIILSALVLLTVSFTFSTKRVSNLHHRDYISLRELYNVYIQLLTQLELFDHFHLVAHNANKTKSTSLPIGNVSKKNNNNSNVTGNNNDGAENFNNNNNNNTLFGGSLLSKLSTSVQYPNEIVLLSSLQSLAASGLIGITKLSKINSYVIYWINSSMKEDCVQYLIQLSFLNRFIQRGEFRVIYDAEVAPVNDDNDDIRPDGNNQIKKNIISVVNNKNENDNNTIMSTKPNKNKRKQPEHDDNNGDDNEDGNGDNNHTDVLRKHAKPSKSSNNAENPSSTSRTSKKEKQIDNNNDDRNNPDVNSTSSKQSKKLNDPMSNEAKKLLSMLGDEQSDDDDDDDDDERNNTKDTVLSPQKNRRNSNSVKSPESNSKNNNNKGNITHITKKPRHRNANSQKDDADGDSFVQLLDDNVKKSSIKSPR